MLHLRRHHIVVFIIIIILVWFRVNSSSKSECIPNYILQGGCVLAPDGRYRTLYMDKRCGEQNKYMEICQPVSCVMSDWGPCDPNTGTQTRYITRSAMYGGEACPNDTQQCTASNDCSVGDWTDNGQCFNGFKQQTRIVIPASNGGAACTAEQSNTQQTVPCQMSPIDCVGSYGLASPCTQQDNGTYASITPYNVTTPATNGGNACPFDIVTVCPPIDCVMSDWIDDGCHWGFRYMFRSVITYPQNGGTECPVDKQEFPCDVDCIGQWSNCTPALSDIGTVKMQPAGTQVYSVSQDKQNNGIDCPANDGDIQACNLESCVNATWSDRSACINGVQTQTFSASNSGYCYDNATSGIYMNGYVLSEPCCTECISYYAPNNSVFSKNSKL